MVKTQCIDNNHVASTSLHLGKIAKVSQASRAVTFCLAFLVNTSTSLQRSQFQLVLANGR